jgi:hypothetical protein
LEKSETSTAVDSDEPAPPMTVEQKLADRYGRRR